MADALGRQLPHHSVSLTGGEPLFQSRRAARLSAGLATRGWPVMLETNGTLPAALEGMAKDLAYVSMDVKLPSVDGERVDPERQRQFLDAALSAGLTTWVKIVVGVDDRRQPSSTGRSTWWPTRHGGRMRRTGTTGSAVADTRGRPRDLPPAGHALRRCHRGTEPGVHPRAAGPGAGPLPTCPGGAPDPQGHRPAVGGDGDLAVSATSGLYDLWGRALGR